MFGCAAVLRERLCAGAFRRRLFRVYLSLQPQQRVNDGFLYQGGFDATVVLRANAPTFFRGIDRDFPVHSFPFARQISRAIRVLITSEKSLKARLFPPTFRVNTGMSLIYTPGNEAYNQALVSGKSFHLDAALFGV